MVYDVAIVGAGPAGASCAYWLAKSGVKVVIFDHSHPREKLCGGIIPQEAVEIFPLLADFKNKMPFKNRILLKVGKKEFVYDPSNRRELFQVLRSELDMFILEEAQKAGAVWIKDRVKRTKNIKGLWNIFSKSSNVQTGFLVGADGARSLTRSYVKQWIEWSELVFVTGFAVEKAQDKNLKIQLQRDNICFTMPKPNCTFVGVAAKLSTACDVSLNDILKSFAQKEGFEISVRKKRSALMPYLRPSSFKKLKIAGDDWLLVGDAAGHCDPLTGEGIKYALWGAKIAADCILNGSVGKYQKLCFDAFAKKLSFSARIVRGPVKNILSALAVLGLIQGRAR